MGKNNNQDTDNRQDGLHIAAVCPQTGCGEDFSGFGVILYDRRHRDGIRIPFPEESRVGSVCLMLYEYSNIENIFSKQKNIWTLNLTGIFCKI